jgi:TonB family protein
MSGLLNLHELHELFGRASAELWPALADHLWQAGLFALLILALTTLLGRARARVRYALWLVAGLKFILPSVLFAALAARLGLDLSAFTFEGERAGAPLLMIFAEPLSNSLEITVRAGAPHAELYCALTLGWLVGCGLTAAFWLLRRHVAASAVRNGREAREGRELEALERARLRLGLGRDVRLMLTERRAGPCVWHTRRPVILLPEEVAGQLEEAELEAVMLHELAHVERRDNLAGLFQAALCCLFWFHPLVWLVSRRLIEERERACDERVLEVGGTPAAYAAGILKVVRFCFGWRAAGASGAVATGNDLRRRIEMIMSHEKERRAASWQRALPLGAVAVALALTLGPALFGRAQASAPFASTPASMDVAQASAGLTQAGAAAGRGDARTTRAADSRVISEIEQAPEVSVRFENAPAAPLVFTDARMRVITRELYEQAGGNMGSFVGEAGNANLYSTLPTVTLLNVSGKTVREVGIGFAKQEKVSVMHGRVASIQPASSQTFTSVWGKRNVIMLGDAHDITIKLSWVVFEDGEVWGHNPAPPRTSSGGTGQARGRPAEPEPPSAPSEPDEPQPEPEPSATARGGGGELKRQVISMPAPSYPAIARAARAQGIVSVRVTVGEEGNVLRAVATSGHPLLRQAAVDAALAAKFRPTYAEGRPVKVSGVMSYNFVLSDEEEGEEEVRP